MTTVAAPVAATTRYRMKDLCAATGLQRQAIHFYIREGLVPPGHKTGRNSAWYGPEHLERLQLVRRLQHERFLPLRAIKAMLDGGGEQEFSSDQRAWLRDVKRRVQTTLARGADRPQRVAVGPLAERHGVTADELADLDARGVLPIAHDADGHAVVAEDDVWVLETIGELRAIGLTRERGFGMDVIGIYADAVSTLFARESALLEERFSQFEAPVAASLAEQVLPLIHRFVTRYHEAKIRRFFAAME